MIAAESRAMLSTPAVSYGSSQSPDAAVAARELYQALSDTNPACVVFFCCVEYDRDILAETLASLFGEVPVIGCTTAGEISPDGIYSRSISGFSLSADHFAVETSLLEDLSTFSEKGAYQTVVAMMESLQRRALAPLAEHSFALTLLDGMSVREELVLSALNAALNGIPLVGGSAGDNMHFKDTHVYHDKQFFDNAAVIILVNTVCPFSVLSGHHLQPTQEKLVVTNADAAKRVVYEFNAEPAALEYCRVMGVSMDELNARSFALHPMAVQVGENTFVRSLQQVNDDLSLTFFCAIDNGIVLTKLGVGGMIDEFQTRMDAVVDEIGQPEVVIGCDCIHRRIEIEEFGQLDQLATLYERYKVVGFNTYGEHSNAMHVNHTFTGVAIGKPDAYAY